MAEHEERPATVMEVKRLIRRKLRRQPPHEENFLNIYPMMDMMTILLVFMIQQFASSSASVVQSSELQIPYSTSTVEPEASIPIQISASGITVDGQPALSLRNGQVDPSQKQGGGNGFLITPLLTVMQGHRDRLKRIASMNAQRPFRGDAQIIADKRTPYRTLVEVVYTLGQSEFKNLRFVVLQSGQGG